MQLGGIAIEANARDEKLVEGRRRLNWRVILQKWILRGGEIANLIQQIGWEEKRVLKVIVFNVQLGCPNIDWYFGEIDILKRCRQKA